MKNALNFIISFRQKQKKYFHDFEGEISVRNLQLTKTVCCAGIVIFCLYYAITKIFFNPWSISPLYLLPSLMFVIILLIIKKHLAAELFNVKAANTLVLITYIFLLATTIILSVFPNPSSPSIYFHLFILAAPVIFILPYYTHILAIVASYVIFIILVIAFKSAAIWPHEIFESFTALLFSFVVTILMSQFRLQSDSLKNMYYKMSQLDGLTRLLNKTSGINDGSRYLSALHHGEYFAVLFLDLDNFKAINDIYGHLMGDELLRKVAEVLQTNCRSGDILCRFGGDEFLIVLKDIHNENTAKEKVEYIRNQIHAISLPPILEVSCSIGVCCLNGPVDITMEDILERADSALYTAKQKGKNDYHIV